MVTLRELMSTDVFTVSPSDSLREVADLLTAEHISGAPVAEGSSVIGVISTTDILDFAVSLPGAPVRRESRADWGEFEDSMGFGIPDEDRAAAVYFTELWANAGADVLERFQETDRPEWDVLDEHTVSEAMSRGLYALSPDTPVNEASRYLLEHDIHRVLVLEDDALVGVVTTSDLVRAIAEHGLAG